ncbi:MAG: hypothetical protein ABWY20_21185 [Mycobacterium sp.]
MSEKRTILTGLGSYVNKRGVADFGFQGEEVEVHEDYLEEFDEMNVVNGSGEEATYERVGVNMLSPVAAAQAAKPEEEEEEEAPAPAKKAASAKK